jgi:hypothetical protein
VFVWEVSDASRLRVSNAGDSTPIAGRVVITASGAEFHAAFPFDSGRRYDVVVQSDTGLVINSFALPASTAGVSTRATAISPTPDTLPANLLRLYVEFSAPMSRESGLPHVKLLDANGKEVGQAFLPLDASFWDHDFRRFTLFLDPGRVKRGILPNEQMGRALVAGRKYSVVVDSTWRDGRGQPLVSSFTKTFVASPADYRPISLDRWRLERPSSGGKDPLVVRFDRPLDRGLLNRAIGLEGETGVSIDGSIEIGEGDRSIRFLPAAPWNAALYHLVVLDILEDVAGNRINRAFEVDAFERADSTATPSKYTIPFRIR